MEQEKPFIFPETAKLQQRLDDAGIIADAADRLLALKSVLGDATRIYDDFNKAAEKSGGWKARARAAGLAAVVMLMSAPFALVGGPLGLASFFLFPLAAFEAMREGQRKKFASGYGDRKESGRVLARAEALLERSLGSALVIGELGTSPKKDELLKALPKLAEKFAQAAPAKAAAEVAPPQQPALPGQRNNLPFLP
jgi:hypothetical protein